MERKTDKSVMWSRNEIMFKTEEKDGTGHKKENEDRIVEVLEETG